MALWVIPNIEYVNIIQRKVETLHTYDVKHEQVTWDNTPVNLAIVARFRRSESTVNSLNPVHEVLFMDIDNRVFARWKFNTLEDRESNYKLCLRKIM